MFGKSILILVPHPDDEVVACAAAIGRAQEQGASVFALYLTHGCVARETLWPWQRRKYPRLVARRQAEAIEITRFLGIVPVGWSPCPARHLWHHLAKIYREIQVILSAHAIDQVWVPAYEGGNADHDALNAVGTKLKSENENPNFVLEFAEYNFFKGKIHAQEFPYPNGSEHILSLTPEEKKKKRAALLLYKSERMNLNYVGIERENFRSIAKYDYGRPPHPGILWYTRFQWVPFRHPRVDFTDPQKVCHAIQQFLSDGAA